MARLELLLAGRKRVFELLDDRLTVGTKPENELRVPGGVEFIVSRAVQGFRLEAHAGGPIRVNGVECGEHELQDGDRIEVGDVVLVYRDERARTSPPARAQPAQTTPPTPPVRRAIPPQAPPPPQQSLPLPQSQTPAPAQPKPTLDVGKLLEQSARKLAPSAAGAGPVAAAARRRGRPSTRAPGGMPGWLWFSSLACVAAVLVWLLVQGLSSSAFSRTPKDLLVLAENQLAQGAPQRALATLDLALADPRIDSLTRTQASNLRQRVATALERQSDAATLASADRGRDLLVLFVDREQARAPARAFARTVVRRADSWLAEYGETVRRHPDARAWADQVMALRERFAPAARLSEPDDAEDLLYRAELTSRQSNRPYRELLQALDAYLASAPDGPDAARVRDARARHLREATSYVTARLRELARGVERGRIADVRAELDRLERDSAPAELQAEIDALRARLPQ